MACYWWRHLMTTGSSYSPEICQRDNTHCHSDSYENKMAKKNLSLWTSHLDKMFFFCLDHHCKPTGLIQVKLI